MAKNPIFDLLLSPLQRIQRISEEDSKVLSYINTSVELLVKSSTEVKNVFIEQRDLLIDMNASLKAISNQLANSAGSGGGAAKKGISMPSPGQSFSFSTFLVLGAAGLAGASFFLNMVTPVSLTKLVTAIAISIALVPIVKVMIGIVQLLSPVQSLLGRAAGFALDKIGARKQTNGMSKNKAMGMALMVIIGAAISVAMASVILQLVMPLSITQLATAFMIGIAIGPMTGVFIALVKSLRAARIAPSKKGLKTVGFASLVMVAIAAGIAGVALALGLLPPSFVEPPEIMWVLQTGFMLYVFALPMTMILKATKGLTTKQLIFSAIAIPLIALAVVAVSLVLQGLKAVGSYYTPPLKWVGKAALTLLVFGVPMFFLARAFSGKVSFKGILKASLGMLLIAGTIVGISMIFQALDGVGWFTPPPAWSFTAGLNILAFGAAFVLIAVMSKILKPKDMLMATLAIVLIAGSVLAVAWIFSFLDGVSFVAPPMDWAIDAAITITIFAIPMAIIGAMAMLLTPVGLLLGAAGIILMAGVIWVVAWIFGKIPVVGDGFKTLIDALLYPINAMVTILGRFKNEIGIENMLPIAGGILAIAGSWLALTAAMAGSALGGLAGAAAGVGTALLDTIGGFFGGEKTKTPFDLLNLLIDSSDKIIALTGPITKFAEGFGLIALNTAAVVSGLGAFSQFMVEDNVTQLDDAATAIKKIATGYKSISDSSNVMNIDAINASSRMFEAIADIAKNGGDDAITTISEKLMEAVEKLSETVENLESANSANSQSMTDAISDTIGGFIDKIKGTKEDGAEESGLIDVEPIVLAIQELEERFSRTIKVKHV